jgi:hypothetical protein
VFTPGDLVSLRRSLAMAPLSVKSQEELIDECERLTLERKQIAAVLGDLPATVGELRAALNKLAAIVG